MFPGRSWQGGKERRFLRRFPQHMSGIWLRLDDWDLHQVGRSPVPQPTCFREWFAKSQLGNQTGWYQIPSYWASQMWHLFFCFQRHICDNNSLIWSLDLFEGGGLHYDLLNRTKEQRTYTNCLLLHCVTFSAEVCLGGISTLQWLSPWLPLKNWSRSKFR